MTLSYPICQKTLPTTTVGKLMYTAPSHIIVTDKASSKAKIIDPILTPNLSTIDPPKKGMTIFTKKGMDIKRLYLTS